MMSHPVVAHGGAWRKGGHPPRPRSCHFIPYHPGTFHVIWGPFIQNTRSKTAEGGPIRSAFAGTIARSSQSTRHDTTRTRRRTHAHAHAYTRTRPARDERTHTPPARAHTIHQHKTGGTHRDCLGYVGLRCGRLGLFRVYA